MDDSLAWSRAGLRLVKGPEVSAPPGDARLRAIHAALPAGMVETDLNQRILGCNAAFAAMLGLAVEQIVGRHGWEFFHSDSPPPQPAAVEDLIAGRRTTYSAQRLLRTADGSALAVQLDWVLVADSDERFLVCIVTDVSAAARTTAELARAREEAVRRQAFTDALLETIDVGVVSCDAEGDNMVRNRAHRTMLGLGDQQAGATPETLAALIDVLDEQGERLTPDRYPLARALRGEVVGRLDARVGPVGGPYRDVVMRATPITTPDVALIGAVVTSTDVTAERTALRDLAAERTLLTEAQRIGQLGSFTYDVPSGQFAYSAETHRIWGLPPTADLTALRASIIHPDDRDRMALAWRTALRETGPHTMEYRIVRPDGTVRHLRGNLETVPDDAGAPLVIHGTHLDVTDLTLAQREAVRANTLFTSILTATPDLIFVTDVRTGGIVYASPGKSILGITSEQLEELGAGIIATLVHPAEQERLLALNRAALDLADGDIQQLVYQARHSDGSWHWLSRRVTPFRRDPATGKVIEVLGVVRDVDHEHRLSLSLRESEARFRALVTQVVDYAIIGLAPGGLIESWNTGAERLKGYTAEQAVGESFEMFYAAEDRAAGVPQQLLATARKEGRSERLGWGVRRDGTTFWADVVITALRDQDGEVTGFVKVTRDLTERHRLEVAQESLFATVSHDLKTPIAAIKGLAEIVSDPDTGTDTRIQFGQRIQARADHLGKLVKELADHANLRAGAVMVTLEPLVLSTLARDCVASLGPLLEDHRVLITDTVDDTVAMADRTAMERVLINLLGNAAKYSPAGSLLRISFEQRTAFVQIAVSDEGRGIAPEDLDTIFDEFTRGRLAQSDGGTGLGLASVRRLVDLQGGRVWMDSKVDRGTTVTVELPRAQGTGRPPSSAHPTP